MSALRVLWVTSVFYPEPGGGSGVHVYGCVKALQRRGHRMTVVAARTAPGTPTDATWPDRVRVLRYEGRFDDPWQGLGAGRKCLELLNGLDPGDFDAVVCGSLYSDRAAFRWAARHRLPCLYFFYGPMDLEYRTEMLGVIGSRRPGLRWLASPLMFPLARWMKRMQAGFIAAAQATATLSLHSQEIIRDHFKLTPRRMAVIPGGADQEQYHPAADRDLLKRELGHPRAWPLIVTVRRLIPRTGVDQLIEAMPSVVEHLPAAVLLVAGQGAIKADLEQKAAALGLGGRVVFLGYVDEIQKARLYQAADVSVVPTASLEGFGLSIAESLACGTPVLGTPVGSIPEILNRLSPRLVLDSAGSRDIASGIVAFAGDREHGEQLRARAAALAQREYTWDAAAAEIEKNLRAIAGGTDR